VKLKELLDMIETKNSWGKNELKSAILDMIARDIEIETKAPSKPLYRGLGEG